MLRFILPTRALLYTTLCFLFATSAQAITVDLTSLQSPVKNQQSRDTCAYFAVSALFESLIKTTSTQDYDISEEFEVFHHKVVHAWRPEIEFGNTYQLLQEMNQRAYFIHEATLPYQKSSPDFSKPLSVGETSFYDLRDKAVPRLAVRGLKTRMITQMWSAKPWSELVIDELNQKRSVVITLQASQNHVNDTTGEFQFNSEIKELCNSGKSACGGHAVLIVGYDLQKRIFKFKNSWGAAWGQKGYGYVSFEHVDRHSDQPLTAFFDPLLPPIIKPVPAI